MLFFTTPPLDILPPVKPGAAVGHSVRYLAEKARRIGAIKEKRKKGQEDFEEQAAEKIAKLEEEGALSARVKDLTGTALTLLVKDMEEATKALYQDMLGDKWEAGLQMHMTKLQAAQAEERLRMKEIEENASRMKEKQLVSLKGNGVYLDDVDPRY